MKNLYDRFEKYLDAGWFFPLRYCSICECAVGYLKSEGQVFFDSNCDCTRSRYTSALRLIEKKEIKDKLSGKLGPWQEWFEKVLHEKGF